jgi:SynChlorMet cassette radical SAM/SPASM protein ScmF
LINPDRISLPEGVPPLNTLYVYLTNGCNLACRHCWLSPSYQPNGGTGGHLDFELFKSAIEEGLPLGLRNVKLTGGEPLLHPDFKRMVDLLQEKELSLTIETNGTLITPALAQYLKESSTLAHISVSLDGAKSETHDVFRGVKGSYDQALAGIRYLVESGFSPQVIMSLHNGNIAEIENEIHLAERLGASSLKFNLVQPSGRGEIMTQRNQVLNIKQLIDLGRWIEKDLQKNTSIQLYYSWPMAFFTFKRLLRYNNDNCGIFHIMGILPTGLLAMCGIGMEIPELVYGKLGTDRLEDVWFTHPTLLALRRDLPGELEGVCGQCIFREQCLGSCVAENYHQSHRVTAPFWFCQQANREGLFPSKHLRNPITQPIKYTSI